MKVGDTLVMQVPTPVVGEVDVLVAGGGTAGCAAAIAAARNGARTLLVERHGCLGGMATIGNAGLTMFMRYSSAPEDHAADHAALSKTPEEVQIAGGIPKEIADRLIASGAGIGNSGQAGRYVFTSSEDFKRLLFTMMAEAGVRLRLHSWVVDVLQEGDRLRGVVVESKSGRQAILARQVIDATGDGDVAARAGVPYTVGVTPDDECVQEGARVGEMMVLGVMFKVGNVDVRRLYDWLAENPDHFAMQPFARFSLAEAREHLHRGEMATLNVRLETPPKGFQVYNLPTPGVVTLCCPSLHADGTDVEELTRAEIALADMVHRWLAQIKESVPGFEEAFLLDCPEVGVRETRHIQGDFVLNIRDIFHQVAFPDRIGRGSHPIDSYPRPKWISDPATAYPPGWYFHIPFGALLARGKANLMVAGRCISATHEAFGCIRPTVQCMVTGEAAGTAAALCAQRACDPRQLPIAALQETLESQGVLI